MVGHVNPYRIAVLAVGEKGYGFLNDMLASKRVCALFTYDGHGEVGAYFPRLTSIASGHGVDVFVEKRPDSAALDSYDVVFVVGWQFLLPSVGGKVVVLHDSLLPRYRGFSPTVTALIKGDGRLGVTAIFPSDRTDAGPVIAQAAVEVTYPLKLRQAFELLRPCYIKVAHEVLDLLECGRMDGTEQDESAATHSIWRDSEDRWIDWSTDAAAIRRFVDALGPPYDGARTSYLGRELIVDEVEEVPDMVFEIRQPGKIWSIGEDGAKVICGRGMIRISSAREHDGQPARFERLKVRLGR